MNNVKMTLILALVATTTILVSCKKTYQCTATSQGTQQNFQCKNCSKDDVAAYQKEIEDKGYTDVSCAK